MAKLTYKFLEIPFKDDAVNSVKKVFNEELGKSVFYRVFVSFKSSDGSWHGPFPMIYDAGAVITLLPVRMLDLLKVGGYATATAMI